MAGMALGMLIFWGLLIFTAVWLVRQIFLGTASRSVHPQDELTPLQVLDLRYSRGEITREQYQQIQRDLEA